MWEYCSVKLIMMGLPCPEITNMYEVMESCLTSVLSNLKIALHISK